VGRARGLTRPEKPHLSACQASTIGPLGFALYGRPYVNLGSATATDNALFVMLNEMKNPLDPSLVPYPDPYPDPCPKSSRLFLVRRPIPSKMS